MDDGRRGRSDPANVSGNGPPISGVVMPSVLRRALASSVSLLCCVVLVACDDAPSDEEPSVPPPRADLAAPAADELADGVEPPSLREAAINDAEVVGDVVVLAGAQEQGGGLRPVVLVSDDGGAGFAAAEVESSGPWARVEHVAGGPDRWFASGWDGGDVPALWTSRDGREWEQVPADSLPWAAGDEVDDLVLVEGVLVAAGRTASRAGDDGVARLAQTTVWSSSDGAQWERTDVGAPADPAEQPAEPVGVVAEADGLSLAVEVPGGSDEGSAGRVAFWRSTDGGRSFEQEGTPSVLDGVGDVRALGMSVDADGRVLLALQGPPRDPADTSWAGIVLRRTAEGWDLLEARAWSDPQRDEGLVDVLSSDGGLVAAGARDVDGQVDAVLTVGRDAVPVEHPVLTGAGDQEVHRVVSTSRGVLAVGRSLVGGIMRPFALLLDEDGTHEVALPLADEDVPEPTDVGVLVPGATAGAEGDDDGPVVLGGAAGSPVAWSRVGGRWQANGLPWVTDAWTASSATVRDAVRVGGTIVAVGDLERAGPSRGAVWTRGSEGEWRLRIPSALHAYGNGYGSTTIEAVAVRPGADPTLVVVGSASVNGQQQALVARSTDGGRWWQRAGTGARREATLDETLRGHVADAGFVAPPGGSISVDAVEATAEGWIAAGSRSEAGGPRRAVFWESEDGQRWTAPQELTTPAHPDGLPLDAAVTSIAVRGGEVVLTGRLQAGVGRSEGWVTWRRSADGSWATGDVVGGLEEGAEGTALAADVVALEEGWLVVGRSGSFADGDAATWTSGDGLRWEMHDLGVGPPATGGAQQHLAAHREDDRVVLVSSDVRRDGAGVSVVETDEPSVGGP